MFQLPLRKFFIVKFYVEQIIKIAKNIMRCIIYNIVADTTVMRIKRKSNVKDI